MGSPSYMQSVVDRNVIMQRMTVRTKHYITIYFSSPVLILCYKLNCIMGSNIYMFLIALFKKNERNT